MTQNWGDPDPHRTWRPGVATAPAPGASELPVPPAGPWSYFPPPDQLAAPWTPPPPVPFRERVRRPAITLLMTTAALVLAGAPLALLWYAVAPPAEIVTTPGGLQPAAPESSQVWAVDGWFVVVSLLAGLVVGLVVWLLRHRDAWTATGLAAGGLLAGAVAEAVGRRLVVNETLYRICQDPEVTCGVYDGTLNLHATPAVVVFPVALLTAFAALTLVFDRG